MKEILYIQAGPLANFVGTHFWNTQESYFTYDDHDDPFVFHDRSFREGMTSKGEATYCPRLLLFDRKSNFGALSDSLYGDGENEDVTPQWGGGVVEHRQDPVVRIEYQRRLEEGEPREDNKGDAEHTTEASNIRFWSDYNRVYFHPRTLQKLPDLADWETPNGDWSATRETFLKHEAEHELVENEVRLFVEECDNLQGIQIINDCATFGGFTDAFLTVLRDDLPKSASITFPLLSNASIKLVSADGQLEAMNALNDALCMRGLENMSTLNVPVQAPATWRRTDWLDDLDLDSKSPYISSAILSTHIETITLPCRLKSSLHDLHSISDLLNPTGTTHTVHLAGIHPLSASSSWAFDVEKRIYDLSAVAEATENRPSMQYARLHVSRGLRTQEVPQYEMAFSRMPVPLSIHAPAYPTPTSFPRFTSALSPFSLVEHGDRGKAPHRVLSTLTTTSATSKLFASYARLAQECVDRHSEVVVRMGLEYDELKELKDDMWALCDRYVEDSDEGGARGEEEEKAGEDEEFE
ncbi:tubulin nucleotide-binding domain-like protein [Fomes fomentarius]|nr:tubulin nucleotide-binding domain-like protein [Fomes fomentarius]